jgi:hypothetical protein
VVRALMSQGMEVTAIHGHLLNEERRLFFLHFRASDNLDRLAKGVRKALDRTNVAKM